MGHGGEFAAPIAGKILRAYFERPAEFEAKAAQKFLTPEGATRLASLAAEIDAYAVDYVGIRLGLDGVAIQDEEKAAEAFLARHGITYPAAFDGDGSVMQAYGITGIPTTVFIDPDGRITGRHAGIFVGDEGVARLQARIDAARSLRR